jgi:hypothetical protein
MKIRIDGIPNLVTVDDAFADLSPEEQGAIVEEIHRQYTGGAQQEAEGGYVSAFRASQQQAEQKRQEESASFGQLAGGLAAGLARGLADVPALPVNLLQLGTLGVEKLTGMDQPSGFSRFLESLPETRDILPEAASYVAPGRAGQFASTIGEFAGGAAGTFGAGAGVSAFRAGARGAAPLMQAAGKGMVTPDVLKYGVAGGAGSEALGQMAEGTDLESLARLTGAIVGPMAVSGATRAVQGAFRTAAERPSLETLRDAKNAAYQAVDDAGIRVPPAMVDGIYRSAVQAARSTPNYVAGLDQATDAALQILRNQRGPQGITLSQLDKVRQALSQRYASSPNQVAILDMIDSIDVAINTTQGGPLMQAARTANSVYKKAELLDKALETAKTGAAVSGTGGNVVNKFRQAVAAILRNPRQLNYFTKQEVEAMTRIARGNLSENVLRAIGKLSPTSGGLMSALNIIHYGSAILSPASLAGTAITVGSKKASEMLTERNLADLRQLFATGQMPVRTPAMAQRGALGLLPSVSTGLLGQ